MNDNDLVTQALKTQQQATPSADLAERAFRAAMNAPKPQPFSVFLEELLGIARPFAAAAGALAVVLIAVVALRPEAEAVVVVDVEDEADAYVEAVLPLSLLAS